jgi:hypothetical protein
MAEIEGGVVPVIVWFGAVVGTAIIGGVVSNVLEHWADFKQGVAEGYHSTVSSN